MGQLRRLFDREIALLERLSRPLRGIQRGAAGTPSKRPTRAGARNHLQPARTRASVEAPVSPSPTRPRRRIARRRRQRPGLGKRLRALRPRALGLALSLALHVVLLAFFAPALNRRRAPGPARAERWIAIRLTPASSQREAPEPPPRAPEARPEPPPEPRELARSTPEPTEAPVLAETPGPRDSGSGATSTTPAPGDEPEISSVASEFRAPPIAFSRSRSNATIGHGSGASSGSRGAHGSRGSGKAAALARYGGSAGTEDAVLRGLRWLAAHQDRDGGWDGDGFNRHCPNASTCFGPAQREFDVGLTALAALAFLGAGVTPEQSGTLGRACSRSLDRLLRSQDASGRFGEATDKHMYNHAIACLTIAEGAGITNDRRMRDAAERGLRYSARVQQARGGWDYDASPTGRNDLSITGWQVMAIAVAERVDIPVSETMRHRAREFLLGAIDSSGRAVYARRGIGAGRGGVAMRAVGMLSLLLTGTPVSSDRLRRSAEVLLRNPPDIERSYEWDRSFQSSYYWYYATLALFHVGGEAWGAWNHFMKTTLLPRQSHEPHEAGSWPPDANWVGAAGGRVASTSFHVLMLEVYYRYPPLHALRKN